MQLRAVFRSVPCAEEVDEHVRGETRSQHLADNKVVRRQCTHKHDRHVACVKELDREGTLLATNTRRLDRNLNAEALQINDDQEHSERSDQIRHVRQTLTVESLFKCTCLVIPRKEQVEESHDCTLKFRTTACVDRRGREGLPHNCLTHVSGNEQ